MKRNVRRLTALFLAALLTLALLPATALADKSTTTIGTAYKDLDPRTEIYMVTSTPGSDYPSYGAKWEPKGGVYYGRIGRGGTLENGRYGLVNQSALENESLISFYYGLDDAYSLEYWSYLYGGVQADGKHGFLVNLNFPGEGDDCAALPGGAYDAKLTETFTYLGTLDCPVFLRIGAEMNVWSKTAAPAQYIAAYRHVAGLARTYCPDTALVFSPNFTSGNRVDMDTFYPGDEYVDWVGVSLYYNRYANNGNTSNDKFFGVNKYGDPMLNVQQTANLSTLHKKPLIVTEGGTFNEFKGEDLSAWASERVRKAYAFLPMVYPQIKAMVYADSNFGNPNFDFTIYDNPTVTAAYDAAVAGNPALLHGCGDTAAYYTKLSACPVKWTGKVELAAYTYSSEKLTAAWYVDGAWKANAGEYPYTWKLDTDTLLPGDHTVRVRFSNGAEKTYSFKTSGHTAAPTNDKLYVDGKLQTPSIYKIDGSNYFKIRDIAALLSGSKKQFEVGYDAAAGSVTVTTKKAYTPNGSELTGPASGGTKPAAPTNNDIYVDGKKLDLTVYKIDGSNYFKLRDLGQALDFYVGYDPATGVTLSGDKGYEAQ